MTNTKIPSLEAIIGGITCLTIAVLIPTLLVFANRSSVPSAPIISPLSDASMATDTTTQVAAATIYSPSDYISLSQRYFNDAYMLSQNREQSYDMKKEILGKLQHAINTISEGIKLYPNKSELWLTRARIYTAIESVAPEASTLAIKDLEQAQRLSSNSFGQLDQLDTLDKSKTPAGLESIKDQQAGRINEPSTRNVRIASPDDPTSPYEDTSESSAYTGTASIPAGQKEITIPHPHVTDTAPIYLAPTTSTNAALSVISKQTGISFTVSLDNVQQTDVPFQYWVTR